jgi:hypothetical protein
MRRGKLRQRVIELCVFIMPIVLVKVAAVTIGSDVAEADATGDGASTKVPLITGQGAAAWPRFQRDAAEHAKALHSEPFGATPLYYQPRGAAPVTPVPTPEDQIDVSLTGIMLTRQGSIALMEGRAYRHNMRLEGKPWRITAIDHDRRAVELTHVDTGRVVLLQVPGP